MQLSLTPNDPVHRALPPSARNYLAHAEGGLSLREIARREGLAPSTVLRQVRSWEGRRDDPLVDAALDASCPHIVSPAKSPSQESDVMSMTFRRPQSGATSLKMQPEEHAVLRRLAETGAVLVVAKDMEKAAVIRNYPDGSSQNTAILGHEVAQALAVKDWIICQAKGRLSRYLITQAGRAALRRRDDEGLSRSGLAEAPQPFAEQHRVWGEKVVHDEDEGPRKLRYNLAESPVVALGRRRDKDGVPFLTPEQVSAGERLREDFELAQIGPRVAQNWDHFLTGGARGGFQSGDARPSGPAHARDRVVLALREIGPGLGDMLLRCCCYLEGVETAEKRLGWSARSGKVVLRIALDRLARHYTEIYGKSGPMIG